MTKQAAFQRKDSGQLLIVAALTIAIMISSTTMYVYEVSRDPTNASAPPINDLISELRQCTRNAMISSLANASNGGPRTVLMANLNRLSQTVRRTRALGICDLTFTVLNDSGYDFGTQLVWNTSSTGVSSSYVDFRLLIDNMASQVTAEYAINLTTSLTLNGSYSTLASGDKNVSLACKITNEGYPALIRNLTVFCYNTGSWTEVGAADNLVLSDCGDGTYIVCFTTAATDPLQVSVHTVDSRSIFVSANTTCGKR